MPTLPPDDISDAKEWALRLLTDLAGLQHDASELLEAIWDVQTGRILEWSMGYNIYRVRLNPQSAQVTFDTDEGCPVPLELLEEIVVKQLQLYWSR